MSIDAISGSSPVDSTAGQTSTNPLRQLRQDFTALGVALKAGDMAGAQSAFATYQEDLALQQIRAARESSTPAASATATPSSGTSFQDLLQALGSALSSGDANAAQQAFQSLQQAVAARGHGHHHHGAHVGSASASPPRAPSSGTVDTTA